MNDAYQSETLTSLASRFFRQELTSPRDPGKHPDTLLYQACAGYSCNVLH